MRRACSTSIPRAVISTTSASTWARSMLSSSGSGRAATIRTARSTISTRLGKASRNRLEMRGETSIRGRPNSQGSMICSPLTSPEDSQTGRTPMRYKISAMSAPPLRIFGVPQTTTPTVRGHGWSGWASAYPRRSWSASLTPSRHPVGVGIVWGSKEKKFRPEGRMWALPRLGAPDGPGATNPPSRAVMMASISLLVASSRGMRSVRTQVRVSMTSPRSAPSCS